jgi:hypothetical protein
MGAPRSLATKLLRAALRHCPEESREWAGAMLRELDFIEGEWEALFWALGGTTAIFQHSGLGWRGVLRRLLGKQSEDEEKSMNNIGKKTVGVLSGAGVALALVLIAFGLLVGTHFLFPSLGLDRAEWTHILTIVVIPEIVFVIAAVMLWRTRRPMAAGILLIGVVLAVHVTMHFASR